MPGAWRRAGAASIVQASEAHAQGLPVCELPSGAGHDAVALSALCPVAMLFVRCRDGVSHHPDEFASEPEIDEEVLRALPGVTEPHRRGPNWSLPVASLAETVDHDPAGQRLLACADAAMYSAKSAGGGTCVVYEPSMGGDRADQVLLQQALRVAMERGELTLHYQPKVDAIGGRVRGLEALLRWRHPEHGMVPPDRFIPIAEETGLIVPIGRWVLREACRQARQMQTLLPSDPPLSMSVTLSVKH